MVSGYVLGSFLLLIRRYLCTKDSIFFSLSVSWFIQKSFSSHSDGDLAGESPLCDVENQPWMRSQFHQITQTHEWTRRTCHVSFQSCSDWASQRDLDIRKSTEKQTTLNTSGWPQKGKTSSVNWSTRIWYVITKPLSNVVTFNLSRKVFQLK